MDVCSCIGSTRNTGANGIANAIDERPSILSQLDGSQRIGRLTTLRDGNDNITFSYYGIPVTELRSVLHLAGNAAEGFYQLFTNESCMP